MWKTLVASMVLLLAGGTAQAAPPRPGLCEELTGDALTRCLYSDLDDRLRATAPPTASPTASPTQVPENGDWLSGASGPDAARGAFGSWRGTPVEIATFWVNDAALYPIGPPIAGCGGCAEWAGFSGPISISAAPKTWTSWAGEAAGNNDAYWTALARKARELRAGKGQVYLNPYYELNGDWMTWSVPRTAAGMADFRTAFARTSAILRREFPGVKVVINPAAGRSMPAEMWPASDSFDVVGIDIYNEWPHCAAAACVPTFLSRITPLQQAAQARGKPIAFPEWGNSAVAGSAGGGGESPAVVDGLHAFFADNAGSGPGQVLYETYFNVGGYPARYELTPTNVQPQTAARYRDRF